MRSAYGMGAAMVLVLAVGRAGADGQKPDYDDGQLAAWLKQLKDKDPAVRLKAAESLSNVRPLPTAIFPPLVGLLKEKDPTVRIGAATLLGWVRSRSDAVVSGLVGALQDPDADVRWSAAQALGCF